TAASWALAARAQQPERIRRISVVNIIAESDPEAPPRVAAFTNALKELGWTDRDLRIDFYWDSSGTERARAVAKQVIETRPDLIVSVSTPVTQALREQAGDIPIVFLQVTDPLDSGLVASLARPGGSINGFTTVENMMGSKWVELLKEIAPHITSMAVVFNPTTAPGAKFFGPSIEAAATSLGVKPRMSPVLTPEDIQGMLPTLASDPNVGLIVLPDLFTTNNRSLIVALSARHRLPTIYPFRYFVREGGLVSYGTETLYRVPEIVTRGRFPDGGE